MIVVGVTGSRSLNHELRDKPRVYHYLDRAWEHHGPFRLAHGCCPEGGDRFAAEWCEERGVEQVPFPPAGKTTADYCARNIQIAEACDILVAFWDGRSGGTRHTMQEAARLGKRMFDVLAAGQGRQPWKPRAG